MILHNKVTERKAATTESNHDVEKEKYRQATSVHDARQGWDWSIMAVATGGGSDHSGGRWLGHGGRCWL